VLEGDLEDLLAADDALSRRDAPEQRIEKGRLAGLGSARHHDVEPCGDGGLEKVGRLQRQHSQPDQVPHRAGPHDETAYVDRPVLARDVGDHDVQPAAVGEHRVHERRAQVDATPGHAQHALDQVAHLDVVQDDRRQLAAPVAGDEHPIRCVQPELLDGGIVEEPLERPESGDGVEHRCAHRRHVVQGSVAK
jgi:hypothetical protein